MNITVGEESGLKRISLKEDIPFSNLLRGYAIEDLLFRIYGREYRDYFWLANPGAIGMDAYREGKDESLRFFYQKSERKIFGDETCPGQPLSRSLLERFVQDGLKTELVENLMWTGMVVEDTNGFVLHLKAHHEDMVVSLRVYVTNLEGSSLAPQRERFMPFSSKGELVILTYSVENALSEALYEIMDKLELVSSMEPFYTVNAIIRSQAVSGRHIVEEMLRLKPFDEKFYRGKRMDQLESYQSYTYMRKRWDQYLKRENLKAEAWTVVMERILKFAQPLWKALCAQEVFFDDWMPELERFLG